MIRLSFKVVAAALLSALVSASASAAEADAPAGAGSDFGDLFTVEMERVDATAGSAILARDAAMAQGRVQAWTTLYRRLTSNSVWGRQPQLDDNQLLRLIRDFRVTGERRSTTRYLADVSYQFNPAAVRLVLRQFNIAYTETRSRPALVISLIEGESFSAVSPWSAAWQDPKFKQGLVPMIPVRGTPEDLAVLSQGDLLQADWTVFGELANRYDAGEVVLAIASSDGNTVQSIEISPEGRTASSFAFAQSTFMADAEAVTDGVAETWKARNSLDYGTRGRIVADVRFNSLAQWARIRSQLGAARAVIDVDVVGLASNEAEIAVTYFGRLEQLQDVLAQQSLILSGRPAAYTLQIGATTAARAP